MSNVIISPEMSLPVPIVGQEVGPQWASDLNACMGIIDGHNHTPGSGAPIPSGALTINAALPFNTYPATFVGYVGFSAQGGTVPTPINLSLYVTGNELYYQDGAGNAVKITNAGSVNATSSGISSGTNTASFVSNILVVDQSAGVGAAIDAASYVLRYNGGYPSPSGNAIVLAAPSALSGSYQVTFPAAAPSGNGSFLTESTTGQLSYTQADGTTLQTSGTSLGVASGGIGTTQLANQSVTQAKQAIRTTGTTVSAGGIAISSACGSFSVPGSATQVTNLSVTITTTGSPVELSLIPGTSGGSTLTLGTSVNMDIFILNGSTTIGDLVFAGSNVSVCAATILQIDTPAAGTYTYHVQATATGTATLINYRLVAREL